MRHRLTTGYGGTIGQRVLVVHDAAGKAPAATVAWVTGIRTPGGSKALEIVARSPEVNGPDLVYRLDGTPAGRAFECLVDNGNAALDVVTGIAVTRAPKRLRTGNGDA